jgi:hypothetical protein
MDKVLTCITCHQSFTFTEGEQRFFAKRDWSAPIRCPTCRRAKRAAFDAGTGARPDSDTDFKSRQLNASDRE